MEKSIFKISLGKKWIFFIGSPSSWYNHEIQAQIMYRFSADNIRDIDLGDNTWMINGTVHLDYKTMKKIIGVVHLIRTESFN